MVPWLRNVQALWTEDHALAWHLDDKFRQNSTVWALEKCLAWDQLEGRLPNILDEIIDCPCTLAQARADTGRFHVRTWRAASSGTVDPEREEERYFMNPFVVLGPPKVRVILLYVLPGASIAQWVILMQCYVKHSSYVMSQIDVNHLYNLLYICDSKWRAEVRSW